MKFTKHAGLENFDGSKCVFQGILFHLITREVMRLLLRKSKRRSEYRRDSRPSWSSQSFDFGLPLGYRLVMQIITS
jgi:hypothetical protein